MDAWAIGRSRNASCTGPGLVTSQPVSSVTTRGNATAPTPAEHLPPLVRIRVSWSLIGDLPVSIFVFVVMTPSSELHTEGCAATPEGRYDLTRAPEILIRQAHFSIHVDPLL